MRVCGSLRKYKDIENQKMITMIRGKKRNLFNWGDRSSFQGLCLALLESLDPNEGSMTSCLHSHAFFLFMGEHNFHKIVFFLTRPFRCVGALAL